MIEVDNQQSLNEELKKNEKVLALFYARWCPYCVRFVPIFKRKISSFNAGTIVHVILDDYDNPIWDEYRIDAVPTIKGEVSKRLDGKFGVGLSEKELIVWFEDVSASKPKH